MENAQRRSSQRIQFSTHQPDGRLLGAPPHRYVLWYLWEARARPQLWLTKSESGIAGFDLPNPYTGPTEVHRWDICMAANCTPARSSKQRPTYGIRAERPSRSMVHGSSTTVRIALPHGNGRGKASHYQYPRGVISRTGILRNPDCRHLTIPTPTRVARRHGGRWVSMEA